MYPVSARTSPSARREPHSFNAPMSGADEMDTSNLEFLLMEEDQAGQGQQVPPPTIGQGPQPNGEGEEAAPDKRKMDQAKNPADVTTMDVQKVRSRQKARRG